MEFLIIIGVVVLVLGAGYWWLQSLRKRNSAEISKAVSREAAQAASAKLDEASRKAIYRNLAKGDVLAAVQNYRAVTGDPVKDCVIAIRSLDAYPQVAEQQKPQPVSEEDIQALRAKLESHGNDGEEEPPQSEKDSEPASKDPEPSPAPASGEIQAMLPKDDAWVVPEEWSEQFGSQNEPSSTHFKLAYEVEGVQHEFSSEQLPPNEYDQLFSMLRDENYTEAAQILNTHTGLPVEDLERMISTSPMAAHGGNANVADFRFEGQGPDGPVSFDAAELPEAERAELFAAIADTDLDRVAAIVVRHTNLPEDMVRNMLRNFVERDK
ncbi:hypothetical protein [Glutamicibacter endophyticus]|uniref:hypothetical protein n=1 Tax=Glutamicibacter endophyticus TaxID=1522174 RepID=UPI003AEFB89D